MIFSSKTLLPPHFPFICFVFSFLFAYFNFLSYLFFWLNCCANYQWNNDLSAWERGSQFGKVSWRRMKSYGVEVEVFFWWGRRVKLNKKNWFSFHLLIFSLSLCLSVSLCLSLSLCLSVSLSLPSPPFHSPIISDIKKNVVIDCGIQLTNHWHAHLLFSWIEILQPNTISTF